MKKRLYLAVDETALRAGSFWRDSGSKHDPWEHYVLGDFTGYSQRRPSLTTGRPLVEFDEAHARTLIPKCCGGKP